MDTELITRVADYIHTHVMDVGHAITANHEAPCCYCQHAAKKLLWMVDAYRKVETA